ncbi:Aspartic proteinase Asp1 [Vitis vinifera]|uniref:Aspartic proteinase Asp1 n=1 Tax=Vitis vinifera TaxID=29760 RepID=A0A438K468_VITVI|nr:Aspartic proteinase Asp1 [Vitis vinifera]
MIQSDSMGPSRLIKRRSAGSLFIEAMRFVVLSEMFLGCFSASNQPISNRMGHTVVFPLQGNVYPQGFYSVSLRIGNPPKPYTLDIDSGSDLTWLQCDAPCVSCTKAPHPPYKPNKGPITCNDPMCSALHWPSKPPCKASHEQCDYEVSYADHGSSLGVLVHDIFSLQLTNGTLAAPRLAFGCGYDQSYPGPNAPPFVDGVLGLGYGKSSIVTQLRSLGLIRSIVGHCLSGREGGFLFLGDGLSTTPGIIWTPMSRKSGESAYALGPADLLFNGQNSGVKGLRLVFDSGSSYTYFNAQAYKTTLSLVRKYLNGKLKETADESLPVCWRGAKPFKSIFEVKNYFKPFALSFTKAKSAQLQLPPESYLIISKHGNACLGILNGSEVGLGDSNVIGDIAFQDKMVIYDNERQQIGWVPKDCNKLPKVDRDYNKGFSPADLGMVVKQFSAAYASREDL